MSSMQVSCDARDQKILLTSVIVLEVVFGSNMGFIEANHDKYGLLAQKKVVPPNSTIS